MMNSHQPAQPAAAVARIYYAATLLFLLLDLVLSLNIRLAFLEPWPYWRGVYYVACIGCFLLIAWRPAWSMLVMTAESLVTLIALILSMGVRAMSAAAILDDGGRFFSTEELVNFVLAGAAAWYGWSHGSRALWRGYQDWIKR